MGLNVATRLALAVAPVAAVSLLGGWVTAPAIPAWYAGLAKPPGTPPNWVFAPVWTTLYAAMAYAAWRILALPPGIPGRERALMLFFLQLALNCAWSFAFFGLRAPPLGLLVIGALVVAIAATIAAFRRLDGLAAALLAPYLAWVIYASYLNGGVWWLNG